MKRLMIAGMTAAAVLACDPSKDAPFMFDEMSYSPTETVFKVFAPEDARCYVVIDGDSVKMEYAPTVDDSLMAEGHVFKAVVRGDQKGKAYEFVVNGVASPGVFAKAVTINGQKGVVVDLHDSDPEGWFDDHGPHPKAYTDWVIYEMHHRDFSIGRPDAVHKGKFLALTEPWALDHLKELGVNAVHILPSYDFGSVDETHLDQPQYNWGYDPVNYNVPEGSYSTDPADPLCRVREFKQMVQALHQAGINVVLDVVYNHTYDIDHSNFQRTFPDYYYRTVDHSPLTIDHSDADANNGQWSMVNVQYSNGSGCGNETASEKLMMRRFMIESVKYWIREYHIDGFRFDLMGCHDIETMNQIRQAVDVIDPTIFIYGEGWSAGACALPTEQLGVKANIPQMPRIAAFSDDMRDALRGPFSDDTKPGLLGMKPAGKDNPSTEWATLIASLKAGIVGMIAHPQVDYTQVNYSDKPYATEPTQMIAYVSCHDDMCLTDRLRASIPRLTEEELIRLDLLAQTAVFTSQGVPFMLSGEELLRTKLGVNNSFESPDSINRLDWANKERYPQVFEGYKGLIAMRKQHPSFRMGSAEMVRKHLEFLDTADGVVAYHLSEVPGDDWKNIWVYLNLNRKPVSVAVPMTGVMDGSGNAVEGKTTDIAPLSALILHN
ncbi:MAG: type I pullulanase [Prevotella sp.]|nr:type I pullulanase [Prevotella sp.]